MYRVTWLCDHSVNVYYCGAIIWHIDNVYLKRDFDDIVEFVKKMNKEI